MQAAHTPAAPVPTWTDVAGLHVQEAMAETARLVLYLTWAQIVLGLVGTIALFITVRESRRASSTALRALRIQQEAERALLVINAKSISISAGYDPFLGRKKDSKPRYTVSGRVELVNAGKSLAQVRTALATVLVSPKLPVCFPDLNAEERFQHAPVDVSAVFEVRSTKVNLDEATSEKLDSGEVTCWLFGKVEYLDLFGEAHHLTFCYGRNPNAYEREAGGPDFWTVS